MPPMKNCVECGILFMDKNGKSVACDECRPKRRREQIRASRRKYTDTHSAEKEAAESERMTRQERFAADIREADRRGLHYGQYIALRDSGMLK